MRAPSEELGDISGDDEAPEWWRALNSVAVMPDGWFDSVTHFTLCGLCCPRRTGGSPLLRFRTATIAK